MTEFRIPSHNKRYDRKSVNRMAFMVFLLVGVLLLFMYYLQTWGEPIPVATMRKVNYTPEPKEGVVYYKPYFSLSYVEKYELPEWVTYALTVEQMNKPKHERDQDFNPDPSIRTRSGHYHDYKSSGYRRGHLVPSADMAWDKEAMDATFLMSNVAPMREEFNDGIWLDLERNVRDWSRRYKQVTVIAGPVFQDPVTTIGDNEILVPRYFYKAIFTFANGNPRVIGFLFDQVQQTFDPLEKYIVSIDSLEYITGLDLFSNLYGDWDTEITLEKRNKAEAGEWLFRE